MSDFETHEIGTALELKLSREFVQLILSDKQNILTKETKNKLNQLLKHYGECIVSEQMTDRERRMMALDLLTKESQLLGLYDMPLNKKVV